jgi:hypothetical protein
VFRPETYRRLTLFQNKRFLFLTSEVIILFIFRGPVSLFILTAPKLFLLHFIIYVTAEVSIGETLDMVKDVRPITVALQSKV